MALIDYVLRDNPDWSRERVEQQLQSPEPLWIKLARPIRVFIVYTTALAAEDGRTLFFQDIYGHDGKLQALLDERSRQLRHIDVSRIDAQDRPSFVGHDGLPMLLLPLQNIDISL
jgi:murein L,D-transpeptidase YcbB/YkuD